MGFSLINHPAIGYHMANLISHTLPQISGDPYHATTEMGLGDPILHHPFGNGLYYLSMVMTGGLCKWHCEIPTAKSCGKVTGIEFWPAKKSQNSHWHGMDRVITKVITAFKETKITSEYLCSLFHQSLTQEKNDTNWYRDKQEFRSSNHPAHHGWFCHACYFRGLLGFNNVQNMSSSNHSYLQGFWIFVYIFQVLPEKGILCQNIPTNCTMLTYLKVEMIMNHSIFGISSLMGLIPFQLCDLDFFHRGIITLAFFSRQRVTLPNACLKMESMEYPPNFFW